MATSTSLVIVLLSTAAGLGSCVRASATVELAVEDTCAAVEGAQVRESKAYPLCKCANYRESVYCEAEKVATRKFNITEVLGTKGCYAPYCTKKADSKRTTTSMTTAATVTTTMTEPTTTTPTTTAEPTTTDDEVENDAVIAPIINVTEPIITTDETVEQRVEASVLFDSTQSKKICINSKTKEWRMQDKNQDPLPRASSFCIETTRCGCMFGNDWHSFYNTFKCCENEETGEFVVQDITEAILPSAKVLAMNSKGCGSMFGEAWHKFTSQCTVSLSYLSSKTGKSLNDLRNMIDSA